jgi:hypothetical protein
MRVIFFNIFLVFLLLIAILFVVFWGKGQTTDIIQRVWPLALIMVLSLIAVNTAFILNWKLLTLLEKEDWPALTAYLEQKIYEKGRYTSRYVKLLTQSCLAMEDFDGVVNLKNRLVIAKPALMEDNALIFGAAYLLGGNTAAAVDFFGERLEKGMAEEMDWLRWYYAFSLILTGSYEKAGAVLEELAADMPTAGAEDILVTGLAAFLLSELTGKNMAVSAEWRIRAEEGKSRVRKTLKTAEKWVRKVKKLKTEVHGAIIRNYVDRTGVWIWGSN